MSKRQKNRIDKTMLPLEGIKVIDLTTWAMAPACSAALGDWGAEVVKVEDPVTGDTFRSFLANYGIDEKDVPVSLFAMDNRNKKGLAVNLRAPEGRDILYKLVKEADVFVSNLPAASLKKLGFDYPRLSEINPRIVYAHATGFGEKGPDAGKPGFDSTTYWARSGLMAGLAVDDEPPVSQQYPGVGDQISGLVLFGGVLLALYNRQKTGQGQQVDLSLLGVGTWVASCPIQFALSMGKEPPKFSRQKRNNPLSNYYQAKDGKWIYIISLPDEVRWPFLCKALSREDLMLHPKFGARENRLKNNIELIALLDEIIATKSSDEWIRILEENGVVCTRIPTTFSEVADDPQVLANKHIVEIDHPVFGKTKTLSTPIRLNKTVPPIRMPAPQLGEHSEEILRSFDYTPEDIAALKKKNVIR